MLLLRLHEGNSDRDTPQTDQKIVDLLSGFSKEIDLKRRLVKDKEVKHIHFGGGTPTFLRDSEWLQLKKLIFDNFNIADDAEIAIEMDPRTISKERLKFFRGLGCNRISLGVQDFNPKVQKAINRLQSYQQVKDLVDAARDLEFDSINFDLIYEAAIPNTRIHQENTRTSRRARPRSHCLLPTCCFARHV